MNKALISPKNLRCTWEGTKNLGYRLLAFSLFIMIGQNAWSQCDITMACNDGVNISLDANCAMDLTPDLILEGMDGNPSEYEVLAYDAAGNLVDADLGTPGTQLDGTSIDQTLIVHVRHIVCDLSCWGTILVQDKYEPTWTNCGAAPVDIQCSDDPRPTTEGGDVPPLSAVDCSAGALTYAYYDVTTDMDCTSNYIQQITRTWVVTDESGNSSSCDQLIRIIKGTLGPVTFPLSYDGTPGNNPSLVCNGNYPLMDNGAPSPDLTGYPSGITCQNIQVYYDDIVFELCGNGFKVLRTWTVIDWCTGGEKSDHQIIKMVDEANPVVTCVQDTIVGTTYPGSCLGSVLAPHPISIFDCSETDYIVGYKLRDESGNPFLNPIYTGITGNSTIGFTIHNLPQDTTWLVYTVTDACGNTQQCFTEAYIEDVEAPTPACEGYTVVSLEQAGWAEVFAETFDDHSWDNCGVDSFAVRRLTSPCGIPSDLSFGESVNFCCADVESGYVQVVLRVWDASGNYNDCTVNVDVQDKMNPTISCPSNRTISCTQDKDNLTLTGEATTTDNCFSTVSYTDSESYNDCGIGTIYRTWTATDNEGRKATCTQIITVSNNDPLSIGDINWPNDLTVNGCTVTELTPELLNSLPVVNNNGCIMDAISYEDEYFYGLEDNCAKVLRHWKVADWCTFDPDNPDYFTHTQEIILINNSVPTFTTSCSNMTIDADEGTCEAWVDLLAAAVDDCTPTASLIYNWEIDDFSVPGTVNYSGFGNNASGHFSTGTYKVTFFATDDCGNVGVCMYNFTIRDNKPPTPICIASVTWVLDPDGTTVVWASDFNLKSEDSCTPDDQLTYSFNAAGTQTSMAFDCSDIPNGIAQEIMLEMHVIDTDGNSEFCSVVLVLQDNNNDACTDVSGAMAQISGKVMDHQFDGLADIEVELMDLDQNAGTMNMTDNAGDYGFESVAFYNDYEVGPYKNDDPLNGVSTLDLVLIQKHILNLLPLDSSHKLIAADINNSQSITAADLIELRKLILGIYIEFPSNTSWRFHRADHEFEIWDEPFGFPEKFSYDDLILSETDVDFVAMKVGDVNFTAVNNLTSNTIEVRNSKDVELSIDNQKFTTGDEVRMSIKAGDVFQSVGMQFTLNVNMNDLSLKNIEAGTMSVNDSNFGLQQLNEGKIGFSWNTVNALDFNKNEVLFTLVFEAKSNSNLDAVQISSDLAVAESYDNDLAISQVVLRTEETNTQDVSNGFALYQNTPNPFDRNTNISYELPEAMNATFTVYDLSGKVVLTRNINSQKGKNNIEIKNSELTQTGVMYYKLEAGSFVQTKKMVVIR